MLADDNVLAMVVSFFLLFFSPPPIPLGLSLLIRFFFDVAMQESHFFGLLLIHQEIDGFALVAQLS